MDREVALEFFVGQGDKNFKIFFETSLKAFRKSRWNIFPQNFGNIKTGSLFSGKLEKVW